MSFIAILIILSQVPNGQRVTITPPKDSGTLPFSVEIPKSWVKNGKWPQVANSDDAGTFQCASDATMTLSITRDKNESQTSVNGSYGVVKKKHPNQYWQISGGSEKGVMVEVPLRGMKRKATMPKDWLTGRYYAGSNRVVFFQWGSTSHLSGPTDRKLVTAIVTSVKPLK